MGTKQSQASLAMSTLAGSMQVLALHVSGLVLSTAASAFPTTSTSARWYDLPSWSPHSLLQAAPHWLWCSASFSASQTYSQGLCPEQPAAHTCPTVLGTPTALALLWLHLCLPESSERLVNCCKHSQDACGLRWVGICRHGEGTCYVPIVRMRAMGTSSNLFVCLVSGSLLLSFAFWEELEAQMHLSRERPYSVNLKSWRLDTYSLPSFTDCRAFLDISGAWLNLCQA